METTTTRGNGTRSRTFAKPSDFQNAPESRLPSLPPADGMLVTSVRSICHKDQVWQPKGVHASPPNGLAKAYGLHFDEASCLVLRLNTESIERRRHNWAFVVRIPSRVSEQRAFAVYQLSCLDLPTDPGEFPDFIDTPTDATIEDSVIAFNRHVVHLAIVPRKWAFQVHRPICQD